MIEKLHLLCALGAVISFTILWPKLVNKTTNASDIEKILIKLFGYFICVSLIVEILQSLFN